MEKENKLKLWRIIAAAVLLAVAQLVQHTLQLPMWALVAVYAVPYLTAGYDVLAEAAEGLAHGEALDENFLMTVATLGAMAIGFLPGAEPQLAEAVAVMLFFQVGELFEHLAQHRSRRSIARLMDIRPDVAHQVCDGQLADVTPDDLRVGDRVVVKPGEKIPVDGVVTEGESSVNTVALTGESVPHRVRPADEVLSGCVNLSGVLHVRVTKGFAQSTASRVLQLVEEAADRKSRGERFITRFARVYTPIVVALALLVALLPPLLAGGQWNTWIYRALTFLVVSCPCALVISVPLAFFGAIGGASRHGVLIKGGNYIDVLARVGTVAFDKTGTVTHGVFDVTAVHPSELKENELLHLAAHVERYSTHPIAASLRTAYPDENDGCSVTDVREVAGQGVTALVNGRTVAVGSSALMQAVGAEWRPCHKAGTIIHVAIDGRYAGHIVVSDRVKDDAAQAMADLRRQGVERLVMLSGDKPEVAAQVAAEVKIDEYRAGLLPADKVTQVERLLDEPHRGAVAFVGDGINDAPVLARADVGIAMGAMGSDAAIEAADVVLMDDRLGKLAQAMALSRRTLRIARQNIWLALGVKVTVLALAFVGVVSMWMAVFADVGVMLLAVLNSTRTLRYPAPSPIQPGVG